MISELKETYSTATQSLASLNSIHSAISRHETVIFLIEAMEGFVMAR